MPEAIIIGLMNSVTTGKHADTQHSKEQPGCYSCCGPLIQLNLANYTASLYIGILHV